MRLMVSYAVIKSGGKQYLAKEGSDLVVDHLEGEVGSKIELIALASFSDEGKVELGTPELGKKVKAEIIESGKGTKIRVSKFKSKVRYRKTIGFRPSLTKIKIVSV